MISDSDAAWCSKKPRVRFTNGLGKLNGGQPSRACELVPSIHELLPMTRTAMHRATSLAAFRGRMGGRIGGRMPGLQTKSLYADVGSIPAKWQIARPTCVSR